MKLLIAIPSNDYMHFSFVQSLLKLTKTVDCDVEIYGGSLVYVARDRLARMAEGYTHVLWLDDDMIFQPEIVEDLLFSGKSFVSAIYHGRRPPYTSCLFETIDPIKRFTEYPTDTFEIAGCGFGCVLMETQILKAVFKRFGTCFFPTMELGEDLAFCQRVSECGFKMYAEPVKVGHLGLKTFYPEDRSIYRDSIQDFDEVERCLTK